MVGFGNYQVIFYDVEGKRITTLNSRALTSLKAARLMAESSIKKISGTPSYEILRCVGSSEDVAV